MYSWHFNEWTIYKFQIKLILNKFTCQNNINASHIPSYSSLSNLSFPHWVEPHTPFVQLVF